MPGSKRHLHGIAMTLPHIRGEVNKYRLWKEKRAGGGYGQRRGQGLYAFRQSGGFESRGVCAVGKARGWVNPGEDNPDGVMEWRRGDGAVR
jgi:hypothetical protein